MNNLKSNPVGIDVIINTIQTRLYDRLDYSNFDGFGRVDILTGKPFYFINDNEYKDLLLDDNLNGHFFFLDNSNTQNEEKLVTEISVIFFLDLKKLKPSITHRADEEIRVEIIEVLDNIKIFKLKEIIKREDALSDFDHKLLDMQPYHFIKFIGSLRYNANDC